MSLQLTVARAVVVGLISDALPFRRTDKGGNAKKQINNPVAWEAVLGVLLALASLVLVLINEEQVTELSLFAATLAVQSVPFLAATVMLGIERVRRTDAVSSPTTSLAPAPAPAPTEPTLDEGPRSPQPDTARAA